MDLISSGLFNMPGVVQEFRFSDGAGTLWSPGNYTGASSQLVVNGTNTFGLRINSSSDGLPYSIVPGETIIQLKSD